MTTPITLPARPIIARCGRKAPRLADFTAWAGRRALALPGWPKTVVVLYGPRKALARKPFREMGRWCASLCAGRWEAHNTSLWLFEDEGDAQRFAAQWA